MAMDGTLAYQEAQKITVKDAHDRFIELYAKVKNKDWRVAVSRLKPFLAEYGPVSLKVATARGFHLYVIADLTSKNAVMPGLDIKGGGEGGYIIMRTSPLARLIEACEINRMISLTPDQKRAVDCQENIQLSACPGSGKTRVIIAKLLRLAEIVEGTPRSIGCIAVQGQRFFQGPDAKIRIHRIGQLPA